MTEAGLIGVGGYVEMPYVDTDLQGNETVFIDFFTHKNFVPISYNSATIKEAAIISDSFKVGDH